MKLKISKDSGDEVNLTIQSPSDSMVNSVWFDRPAERIYWAVVNTFRSIFHLFNLLSNREIGDWWLSKSKQVKWAVCFWLGLVRWSLVPVNGLLPYGYCYCCQMTANESPEIILLMKILSLLYVEYETWSTRWLTGSPKHSAILPHLIQSWHNLSES